MQDKSLTLSGVAVYGARQAQKAQLLDRFYWCQLGITIVGLGSFAFHCTLKYWAQLLDELPMIWVSMLITYCCLETAPRGQPARFGPALPIGLAVATIAFTLFYVQGVSAIIHQVVYATIQLASTIQVTYLLYSSKSPFASGQAGTLRRRQARILYGVGAVTFLTGFAIWNVDNIFCSQVREARNLLRANGLGLVAPWVNGHLWWHFLTGLGAYQLVVSSSLLLMSLKEAPENFELRPSKLPLGLGHVIPTVVRVKPWAGKQAGKLANGNGSSKKSR